MANPEHLAILKQGVEQWNKWRKEHPDVDPDLSGADLTMANLGGADLSELWGGGSFGGRMTYSKANLQGARLRGASLTGTQLRMANLSEADLYGSNLRLTDFRGAQLNGADLGRAFFSEVDLRGADLREADFTKAFIYSTNFADINLRTVRGLETVILFGPSTIGIDTIYKSEGKIPESFLRGCGVPDELIAYIDLTVARPIGIACCFISYSTKDQAFADRLYADLQAKGVRCWFAPHDIMGGRKIHEQIDEAIRVHDKLLLILSEHSMASDWVGTEIANAREREAREKKQMLFPITIAPFEEVKQWKKFDADRGKDSAREIREYYIPDFSNWDRDNGAYQKEFEKLVTALKAGASSQ